MTDEPKTSEQPSGTDYWKARLAQYMDAAIFGTGILHHAPDGTVTHIPQEDFLMKTSEQPSLTGGGSLTDGGKITSEQPSGHLRWRIGREYGLPRVLQQLWYITTYHGIMTQQVEEWRDVPFVGE